MLIFLLFQGCFVDKLFNFRNYLILNILLFFVIVIFRMQNLFAFLIEDILHKNLTLTGRTVIWDRTLELIGEKPILGHGVPFYEDRKPQYAIETK
ncbi:MAG: O-antigen ligase family protein [[Clostridium] leptum]